MGKMAERNANGVAHCGNVAIDRFWCEVCEEYSFLVDEVLVCCSGRVVAQNDECASEISVDDQAARQHLRMSGQEFAERYRLGQLEDSCAVSELGFLLRCIDDSFVPAPQLRGERDART
jgi:hypothetical protein